MGLRSMDVYLFNLYIYKYIYFVYTVKPSISRCVTTPHRTQHRLLLLLHRSNSLPLVLLFRGVTGLAPCAYRTC